MCLVVIYLEDENDGCRFCRLMAWRLLVAGYTSLLIIVAGAISLRRGICSTLGNLFFILDAH
jgi:hypothetical protein